MRPVSVLLKSKVGNGHFKGTETEPHGSEFLQALFEEKKCFHCKQTVAHTEEYVEKQLAQIKEVKEALFKGDVNVEKLNDKYFDVALGIKTVSLKKQKKEDSWYYVPTRIEQAFRIIEGLKLEPNQTFYDIGCGVGRVVFLAALMSGARCIGLDFEKTYIERAKEVADRNGIINAEFRHGDALKADISDGDVFFLYSPFVGQQLQDFFNKLKGIAESKDFKLAVTGPADELARRQDWLICDDDGYFFKVNPYFRQLHPIF